MMSLERRPNTTSSWSTCHRMIETRHRLATVVTLLIAVIALSATVNTGAERVLDQLMPVMLLILGYYFGSRRS